MCLLGEQLVGVSPPLVVLKPLLKYASVGEVQTLGIWYVTVLQPTLNKAKLPFMCDPPPPPIFCELIV